MNIAVLTADRSVFEGAIKAVKVPGVSGTFQILNNHAPIVSALDAGTIAIDKSEGGRLEFRITGGFIEVLNNEVSLLVQGVSE